MLLKNTVNIWFVCETIILFSVHYLQFSSEKLEIKWKMICKGKQWISMINQHTVALTKLIVDQFYLMRIHINCRKTAQLLIHYLYPIRYNQLKIKQNDYKRSILTIAKEMFFQNYIYFMPKFRNVPLSPILSTNRVFYIQPILYIYYLCLLLWCQSGKSSKNRIFLVRNSFEIKTWKFQQIIS